MYKALAYKEWLKIKWVVIGSFILELILLTFVFTNLRAVIEYNGAVSIWTTIIYRSYFYFGIIKYVPLLMGIAIAISQYVPEILDMKLKLTLHLPLDENKVLLFLNFYGIFILLLIFVPLLLILILGSAQIFPVEVIKAVTLTILPWFLVGFLSYFFTASILIEPTWIRRLVLSIVGFFFASEFLIDGEYGAYQKIIFAMFLITILFSYSHMLSGLRFKRGSK